MFTIKCDKCNAEAKIKLEGRSIGEADIVIYSAGHEGQIGIACCKCDNETEEDY